MWLLRVSSVLLILSLTTTSVRLAAAAAASNSSTDEPEYGDELAFDFGGAPLGNNTTATRITSEFVAKVNGGVARAKRLARQLNLKLVRRVFPDSDYFLFEHDVGHYKKTASSDGGARLRRRSIVDKNELNKLRSEPTVSIILRVR